MRGLVAGPLAALSFLTRIPVPMALRASDHGAALLWFPAVGLLIGGLLLGLAQQFSAWLSHGLLSLLLVVASALLTGGLHLDGVADTFDAAGGGRGDRTRMLTIMKDSRIGAHGAVALALVLGVKAVASADLLALDAGWAIALAPAMARACVVPVIAWAPSARPDGLGSLFHLHARAWHVLGAGVLVIVGLQQLAPAAWPCLLSSALVVAVLGGWSMWRLGGLTGDVHGAAIELAEVVVLVVASGLVR